MIIGGLKNLNSYHPLICSWFLLIVVVSLVAISVIAIVKIRIRLKNKSKELSEKLKHISSYSNKSNYEQAKERLSALNNETFIDPRTPMKVYNF